MKKLLEINNATKVFRMGGAIFGRKLTAVDQVSLSLDAEPPGILSVVGESGCGKTTLCKMILRIHGIDSGDISLTERSFAISDILKGNLFTKSLFGRVWKSLILLIFIGAFSMLLLNQVMPMTQYGDIEREIQVIQNLGQEIEVLEARYEELNLLAEQPGASAHLRQQANETRWLFSDLRRLYDDYLENEGISALNAISASADSLRMDIIQNVWIWSIIMGVALALSAILYLIFVKKQFKELCSLGMPKHVAIGKSLIPVAIVGFLAMIIGGFISWNNMYGYTSETLRLIHNPENLAASDSNEVRWLNMVISNAEENAVLTFITRTLLAACKLLVLLALTALGALVVAKHPKERMDVYDFKSFRKDVQPIFQNPYETFSMHKRVDSYLFNTAKRLGIAKNQKEAEEVVDEVLRSVGMSLEVVRGKYAAQFSGGELQRVSIARALIPRPKLIVADEPVAAIDASMKMNIVNLFKDLKDKYNVSFVYITHDLSTAYYVSDNIATLYRGALIEYGPAKEVMDNPAHPYTELLMNAVPRVGDKWHEIVALPDMEEKEYSLTNCKFAPRCTYATDLCRQEKPKLRILNGSRQVLCNYPLFSQ
jgi:peptide/nickel transport system ATP-binding protein